MSNPFRSEQVESAVRRRKLVADAVVKLYLARDGGRLGAQLQLYDAGIAPANLCRDDELKRAKETDVTTRVLLCAVCHVPAVADVACTLPRYGSPRLALLVFPALS